MSVAHRAPPRYTPPTAPSPQVGGLRGLFCLTLVGWLFSIVFTYTGFALMLWAVVWSANLHSTLKRAWTQAMTPVPSRPSLLDV